ncbi:MAG TPA: DUF3037 domain-containing protein [Terriglobales bacterium]|jgi:hypothetical protein|nr:DUF3037 domain-containing protein [Terriglobales bacterium]
MAERRQLEFFLLRYVPDAVKDEFVNLGVVLLERNGGGFAGVRFTRDWSRVRCLDPAADLEVLAALEGEVRTRLAETKDRDAFLRRIQESFSGSIQLSPTRACLAEEPQAELESLAAMYLESTRRAGKRAAAGRQAILGRMRDAFEQAGAWALMQKKIEVAKYTHKGDPLKLDCGYKPNGVIKLFHAVSLAADVDSAKVLAFSYPQISDGILRVEKVKSELTAVVEDKLDRNDEAIAFALETLERSRITVAAQSELPQLAEAARRELKA